AGRRGGGRGRGRGGKRGGPTTPTGGRRAAGPIAAAVLLGCLAATEAPAREPGEVSFAPGPDLSVPGAPGRPLADPPRPAPREHFRVIWFDPKTLLPGMSGAVARELGAVFATIGVNVGWQEGGLYGEGSVPEVPVIVLREDPRKSRAGANIMGLVIRDQAPTRAVWVFLDPLLRNLGILPVGRPLGDDEKEQVSRALARGVAHEAVHAIAPDEPHTRAGLMRHSLDRAFLLGRRAALEPACASAFLLELDLRREAARGAAARNLLESAPIAAAR